MSGVYYTPVYYVADDPFPSWAQGVGWILAVLPILWVVLGAIVGIVRCGGVCIIYDSSLSITSIQLLLTRCLT